MVVLISMRVEEKIVVSHVWSLSTQRPTGWTDRQTDKPKHVLCVMPTCGKMFEIMTKGKIRVNHMY